MRTRFLASIFFSAGLVAVPFVAQTQSIYGGAQTLNGLQNQGNTRSNFQLQERQNAELRRSFRAQDMIEQEKQSMKDHPLKPPVLYVTDDPGADALDKIAKLLKPGLFSNEPIAQVRRYVGARYADYVATARAGGMKPSNLASACDYAAEKTYEAGAHIDASGSRETIRGTCVMFVQQAQSYGHLATNAQRVEYLQMLAVAGSTFHDLGKHVIAGATYSPASIASQARDFFQSQFHVPMAAVPPSKFECVFATPAASCDTIARIYPKYVKAEAARYP